MTEINRASHTQPTTPVDSTQATSAATSTAPDSQALKAEYTALKRNASIVFSESAEEFRGFVEEQARAVGPKLLGNRKLYEIANKIASRLEAALSLSEGSISKYLPVKKTPIYTAMKGISSELRNVGKAFEGLDKDLEAVRAQAGTTDPDAARSDLRAKLVSVREAVENLQDHVDYDLVTNDPEKEKFFFNVNQWSESVISALDEADSILETDHSPDINATIDYINDTKQGNIFAQALDRINASKEKLDFNAWIGNELTAKEGLVQQTVSDLEASIKGVDPSTMSDPEKATLTESLTQQQTEALKVADGVTDLGEKLVAKRQYGDNPSTEQLESLSEKVHTAAQSAQTQVEQLQAPQAKKVQAQAMEAPKQDIFPPQEYRDAGHYNIHNSTAKPDAVNPSFYHEKQSGSLCLKHAANAFVGFSAFSVDDLVDANVEATADIFFKNDYNENPARWLRNNPQYTQADIDRDGENIFREMGRDMTVMMAPEKYGGDLRAVVTYEGNDTPAAVKLLQKGHRQLGLPEPKSFIGINGPQLTQALEEAKRVSDRIMLVSGGHYVTYRENKHGDWFLINSLSPNVSREGPEVRAGRSKGKEMVALFYCEDKDPQIKSW